jgi:hypothetical protein
LRSWGRLTLAGAVLATGALVRGGPVEAADEAGLGQASAQMLRVEPTSAGLSFGVIVAPISSDHRNDVARAVAQSTNFGLVGAALTATPCNGGAPSIPPEALPKVFRTDSRDADAGAVKTITEGPVTQTIKADSTPDAASTGRLADLGVPGVVTMAGLSERTSSGIGGDGVRVATAHVEVAEVELLGGLVALHGIAWDGRHHGVDGPSGGFHIGSASIAGAPIPTQDPAAVLEAVNAVTSVLGVTLESPEVREVGANVYVDPLTIAVVPNPSRDALAAALLAGVQPLREAVFDAFIAADCGNAAYVTIIDLLLGSLTGSGTFQLSLGGVDAGSSVVDSYAFASAPPPPGPVSRPAGPTADRPSPPEATPAARPAVGPTARVAAPVDDVPDGAVPVALAALALGALLVELDRRKMRSTLPPGGSPP